MQSQEEAPTTATLLLPSSISSLFSSSADTAVTGSDHPDPHIHSRPPNIRTAAPLSLDKRHGELCSVESPCLFNIEGDPVESLNLNTSPPPLPPIETLPTSIDAYLETLRISHAPPGNLALSVSKL
jgi:hypothetical protein